LRQLLREHVPWNVGHHRVTKPIYRTQWTRIIC
jgi:hypothetical protein